MSGLLHTPQVAELTGAPEATVRWWRYAGTGPKGFRLGRRVVYRREDVEAWIAEREAAEVPTARR